MLELHVQDFLEASLKEKEFARLKDRPFWDRVERIKEYVTQADHFAERRQAVKEFFLRLEPIRELRNHIAHGILRIGLAQDQKTLLLTLSLPRELDGSNSPDARHLTFEELLNVSTTLTDLIEDFERLFGNWVVDSEISF